jgi:hypothetical protein
MLPFQADWNAYYFFLAWNFVGVGIQCFGIYAVWHGRELLMRWYSRLYWIDVLMRVAQSVCYATIEVMYRNQLISECIQQNPNAGNQCAQQLSVSATVMIGIYVALGLLMMMGGLIVQSYWSQLDETIDKHDIPMPRSEDELPAYRSVVDAPPAYPDAPPMYIFPQSET